MSLKEQTRHRSFIDYIGHIKCVYGMDVFSGVFIFWCFDCALQSNKFSSRNCITLPDFRVLIRSFSGGMFKMSNYLKSDLTV